MMLKNEMIKLLHTKSVYAAILIGIFSCICGLYSYYDTAYWAYTVGAFEEISAYNAWMDCLSVGTSVYRGLLPLLIVPFLDSYFQEQKSGYQMLVLARTTRNRYFFTKWIVGVISAAGIAFLILMVTLAVCVVLFPLNQPLASTTPLDPKFGLNMFLRHPMLWIFLMILSNMFYAAIYYTVGFGCTNFVSNRFLLMMIPFILHIFQLMIWQFLRLSCVSPLIFIAYYEAVGVTPLNMVAVGIVYILCAAAFLLCCWYLDRKTIR